jgi:hypothetical protein
MKNVELNHDKKSKKLHITIDLDQCYGDSKSGRTTIVASTEGNVRIDPDQPDLKLGLNLFRTKPS